MRVLRVFSAFSLRLRHSALTRYSLAAAAVGAALVAKLLLAKFLTRDEPGLLFFGAVIVSAAGGGFGPGLLATGIGAICDEFFFMAPYDNWHLNSVSQGFRLGIFFVEAAAVSGICSTLKSTQLESDILRRRAERETVVAQKLQREILQVSDAERSRLGHELHDGLGQNLTGISLLTRSLQERLKTTAPTESAAAGMVSDLVKDALVWTHDLCRMLSPLIENQQGLYELLQELAAKSARLFGIDCQAVLDGQELPVSPAVCNHLYRISQEAITNAVRHGKAKAVVLNVTFIESALALKISDDGAGIGPVLVSSEGMGLKIMRYRARMIGGSITFGSSKNGGTSIVCNYALPSVLTSENSLGD